MNFLVGLNVAGDLSAADNAPRRNFGLNDRRLSDNQCSMGDDFSFDFSINPDGAVIGNHPFELGPFSKKSDDLFRLSSLVPFISSQRSLLKGRKGSRSFPSYIRSPESGPVRAAIPYTGRPANLRSLPSRSGQFFQQPLQIIQRVILDPDLSPFALLPEANLRSERMTEPVLDLRHLRRRILFCFNPLGRGRSLHFLDERLDLADRQFLR